MLKSFEDTGWRIDKIDELKYKLNCPESYKNFATFREKVLDMAFKEINNLSDIRFTYESIKIGRKVTSIKFHITSNRNKAMNELAITSKEIETDSLQELELIKQVQVIFNKHKITDREAAAVLKDSKNDIDFIKQCYKYLLTKDKIDNVVGYMRKLVKCYSEPQCNNKVDTFNDYPQREYDFKDLEARLLGHK